MSAIELSVVLPTFNGRENILPLIERLESALAALDYEIIVVDDDSPDGTWSVVAEHAASHPAVRLIRRVGRSGLTSAIQEGIDASRGEAVAWMDCDLSMPPEMVAELFAGLSAADVSIGSRYVGGGVDARDDVPVHRLFSSALNVFARALLGAQVSDYTTGFVCAKKEVFARIRLVGNYGEYCIDFLHRARRAGFEVVETPYRNIPRVHGESKTATNVLGLFRRGWRYVTTIARLRWQYGR